MFEKKKRDLCRPTIPKRSIIRVTSDKLHCFGRER